MSREKSDLGHGGPWQDGDGEGGARRRPGRLGDSVYDTLLNELLSGSIEPGSRIMIDRLSRSLGVSQSPIREALLRLEAQGLVTKTHLVGYRAAEMMSRRQFEELYEMRLLLEPFAVSGCARLASEKQIGTLEHMTSEMKQQSGRGSYASFAQQDAEFHEFIAFCGGTRWFGTASLTCTVTSTSSASTSTTRARRRRCGSTSRFLQRSRNATLRERPPS